MRGSQFSSCNISLPYRRYGRAALLGVAVVECSKVLLQEIVYILHRIGRSGHSAALYLRQAAIDEQLDASYVAGVVGGQKQNGLRDFIRGAGTAQGNIAN
jgi:hypothetical protein